MRISSSRAGVSVGDSLTGQQLRERYDAVVLAMGATQARDLDVPGRELAGVHFAMDYLYQRNRAVAGMEGRPSRETPPDEVISAAGKRVVVVGGGDTGMDCISNALREGAEDVLFAAGLWFQARTTWHTARPPAVTSRG